MHANDRDVTGAVRTTDPAAVSAEVLGVFRGLFNGSPAGALERAFRDVAALYRGQHPAYLPCDTEYHDLQHVLDVTLAMARLMDGYQRGRGRGDEALSPALFTVGATAALFHDFGYLRRRSDRRHRYGAEYTLIHVSRGSAFLRDYITGLGLGEAHARLAATLVHFTGYERPVASIRLSGALARRIGQMLGSADILAQMSDRCYLEKCRNRLYPEFVLGRLGGQGNRSVKRALPVFASGDELVQKTPAFCQGALKRLEHDLGRSYEYAARHFGGENLYLEAIRKNVRYAERVSSMAKAAELLRREPPRTLAPQVQPYPKDLVGL
jgi:hypothetical protein